MMKYIFHIIIKSIKKKETEKHISSLKGFAKFFAVMLTKILCKLEDCERANNLLHRNQHVGQSVSCTTSKAILLVNLCCSVRHFFLTDRLLVNRVTIIHEIVQMRKSSNFSSTRIRKERRGKETSDSAAGRNSKVDRYLSCAAGSGAMWAVEQRWIGGAEK